MKDGIYTMKDKTYVIHNLPKLTINERLSSFVKGIQAEIYYEAGYAVDENHSIVNETDLQITIEIKELDENLIDCLMHNLYSAKPVNN
jgi:hypothetical protein